MGAGSRRTLVLGGSGMLGTAVVRELLARGGAPLAPTRRELDLSGTETLRAALAEWRPAVVVNAAAFTDVAGAEDEARRDEAYRMNRDLPAELARWCAELGMILVHVSTDYVFDGSKTVPYAEEDATHPLQVYGQSKLAGERAVLDARSGAIIVRTSTLYGPGQRARPHYVDAVLRQAHAGARLEVVRLPVSSPTYAPDLARALLALAETSARGLVHAVNDGACSRLELAREIVRLAGLGARVEVVERPEPSGALLRPPHAVLDTSRLARVIGRPMRPWQEALSEYVQGRGPR